jgi:hypothetical protein
LEVVLITPVVLVILLAVIQFGTFFANMQMVALACRVGAQAASESTLPAGGQVPTEILQAIDQQLLSCGIQRCRVRLEHNASGYQSVLLTGDCDGEVRENLPAPLPPDEYVRLSVCVPLAEIMPNLLASFGFDVNDERYVAECTTLMRHKL